MQGYGAPDERVRVGDPVNGFAGIDLSRIPGVDDVMVVRPKFAEAGGRILVDQLEIVHLHFAARHRHPATLVAMIVDGALLSDFPADGQKVVERRALNQVAGVVVPAEVKIRLKALQFHRVPAEEFQHVLMGKLSLRDRGKLGGELFNRRHNLKFAEPGPNVKAQPRSCRLKQADLIPEITRGYMFPA